VVCFRRGWRRRPGTSVTGLTSGWAGGWCDADRKWSSVRRRLRSLVVAAPATSRSETGRLATRSGELTDGPTTNGRTLLATSSSDFPTTVAIIGQSDAWPGFIRAARRRAAAASISDRLSWSLPASLPPPLGRVRRRGRVRWLTALSSRPAECIHLVAYWAGSRRVNGDGDGVMLPCRYLSTSSFQRTTTLHVVTANVALILHRCAAVPPSHVDRGRAVYTRLSALERRCIWASVHAETRSFYSSCSRLVKIILDTLWAYKVAINAAWTLDAACPACHFWFHIHLYSPYNMVTANNTGTSMNTTNEKKIMTVPLYTHKIKH